jgi:RNA polymerase sigma factor (sigma-70 family)
MVGRGSRRVATTGAGRDPIPDGAQHVPPAVSAVADDALIAAMADGDTEASSVFVRRYQARVYGLAVTIVGDRGRAEDVAQEAFVRAWRHAEAFDPRRGSAAGWLLTITRNLALDARRSAQTRPTEPLELFLAGLAEQALNGVASERVRAAVAALPLAQRRAVMVASFGGRTARELGELEGIPLGTAKTRIRDGLLQLRRVLIDEGADR